MATVLIVVGSLICAIFALRAQRVLISALWLAGTSALVALLLFTLGAPEIAVIELSVGAGLVTVLFVFAINIAGEETYGKGSLIPRPLAWALIVAAGGLMIWMILGPQLGRSLSSAQPGFADILWNNRTLDVVLQVVLIFSGVLGVLGLLSDAKMKPKEDADEH
jgi:NADH:ubiquinone oxidoreductase subunit 6 (subunit J)